MKNYQEMSKHDESQKIVKLDNQALVADQLSMQQEILKGNFKININDQIDKPLQIEKYAQEPVAYFLHKKRDFLHRLFKTKALGSERETLEYQNLLRFIAGETKEGRIRQEELKKKRLEHILKYNMLKGTNGLPVKKENIGNADSSLALDS